MVLCLLLVPSTGFAQQRIEALGYSVLHLRHNQDATPEVTVTAQGQSRHCRVPCEISVPPGEVTVRAGRAERTVTVDAPELVMRLDLGWREPEFGVFQSAGIISVVSALAAVALSLALGLDSDCNPDRQTCIRPWALPAMAVNTAISGGFGIFYLGALASNPRGEVRVLGSAGRRRHRRAELTPVGLTLSGRF